MSTHFNKTASDLFDRVRQSFQRKYSKFGREMSSDGISLDFEVETKARIKLTPEVLMLRGGLDLKKGHGESNLVLMQKAFVRHDGTQKSENSARHSLFPKVSDWFEVGLDGIGLKNNLTRTYRQQLSAILEIGSVPMTPKTALKSDFLPELNNFLERLGSAPAKTKLSKSLEVVRTKDLNVPCRQCGIQFTVGLPLAEVPKLLLLSPNKKVRASVKRANAFCDGRPSGCDPEYKGLVLLAAWVLRASEKCRHCGHPKRCISPWLVRTHFGDMAHHVARTSSIEMLPEDILAAAGLEPHASAFPKGVIDYMHLPEMAEYSGLVISRDLALTDQTNAVQDMPITASGIRRLALNMIENKKMVNHQLVNRECGVFGGMGDNTTGITVGEWANALMLGKDFFSDIDSPISHKSFSGLVWKSMGSWRMHKGDNKVYLECRSAQHCLRLAKADSGPAELIRNIAKKLRAFEKNMVVN